MARAAAEGVEAEAGCGVDAGWGATGLVEAAASAVAAASGLVAGAAAQEGVEVAVRAALENRPFLGAEWEAVAEEVEVEGWAGREGGVVETGAVEVVAEAAAGEAAAAVWADSVG